MPAGYSPPAYISQSDSTPAIADSHADFFCMPTVCQCPGRQFGGFASTGYHSLPAPSGFIASAPLSWFVY
ncbi:MAG TPA: hypothetical protein DHW39_07530 [Erysipelotrichaceae bacterium]|nr:hypothetical protein [Erysipelotrichaceae bacterium]